MNYAEIHRVIQQNDISNKRLANISDSNMKALLSQKYCFKSIALKDVAKSFFEPTTLRHILEEKINVIDRKGNYSTNGDMQPRYFLIFGNTYGLDDAKTKEIDLYGIKFPKNLVDFISNSFDRPSKEAESIKISIQNPNNRVFMILQRSTIINKSDKKNIYHDKIIAAATCKFHTSGCILLWFVTKKIIKKDKSEKDQFRQKGFGTLLLSVVQTCQEIMHGNNTVICQANIEASVGFYLQHHFEIITEENEAYATFKNMLESIKSWIINSSLILLKSRAKLNVLHTWMYEDTVDANAFNEYIIPQLVHVYFPDVTTLGHYNNIDTKSFENIIHDIDPLANIKSFEWSSCIEEDKQDETNSILFASNETLEKILSVDNCTSQCLEIKRDLLPSYENNDHTDNLFYIMSQILYDNNDHENDIRCFLGFLYSCFSVVSDDHPFLKFSQLIREVASNNLQSFNIAKDLCDRLFDEYDDEDLFPYLGFDKNNTIKTPKVMKMAFKLLKCHIIPYGIPTKVRQDRKKKGERLRHVTFSGYPMDLVLFSNIICPSIYVLSSETYQNKDSKYNQRLWHSHLRLVPELKCITYSNKLGNSDQDKDIMYLIGHAHNNEFQLFRLSARMLNYGVNDYLLKSKYRAKYYNINEPDNIYLKTNKWLNDSNGKYFQNRDIIFKFQDFTDANVKLQNYLPIVRIVDPLKRIVSFFKDKYCSFTSRLVLSEFLAFQPTAWLQDSGLDDFYSALESSDNKECNERICIIGPNKAKKFKQMENVNDNQFKIFESELTSKKRLCIQINTGIHFITAEVNQLESIKNKCWVVMVADSMGNSDDVLDSNKGYLESNGVVKFLQLLQPDFGIEVTQAENCTIQNNGYDCGVHGARRFYSYWKYDKVFPQDQCNEKIMQTTPFRLHMLEYMLEQAPAVSCYISPSGRGNTIPIHAPNDDKIIKETKIEVRNKRNDIKKSPVMPIPKSSVIYDVDEIPEDNDMIGKQIIVDYTIRSQVNINFDAFLLDGTDMVEILQEPATIDNATSFQGNDNKDILQQPIIIDHDTNLHTDILLNVPAEEHSLSKPTNIDNIGSELLFDKPISPQNLSSHLLETSRRSSLSSEDNDTGYETAHSNPKKPFGGKLPRYSNDEGASDNESTEVESHTSSTKTKHLDVESHASSTVVESHTSSTKTKQNDDKVGGEILLQMKNVKKQEQTRTSPRSKNVTNRNKSQLKKITIKKPSKTPKTENWTRPTTKQRPNRTKIGSKPPQRFGDTHGKTIKEVLRNQALVKSNTREAIKEGNVWDLITLQPIPNYTEIPIDEPTSEIQQTLIANRIKELNTERLKLGENELTNVEEAIWEKYYYHKTQLDTASLEESLQNEVSVELTKATALETKLHDAYIETKRLKGDSDRLTKRKYDQYVNAKVEVTMLQFELQRNPYFHPYNSIWSIRIDDNDPDDEKSWNYYVVYKGSDKQFYEAPVAKGWLVDNLDPKYMKDLKTHCRARRYILYDDYGAKLTKNFKPYIEHLPRDDNNNLVKPIYTYRPKENDVKILNVRAVAIFSKSKITRLPIMNDRISWSVYYLDRDEAPSKSKKYISMKNSDICDIIDQPLMVKWKKEIHQWFKQDYERRLRNPSSLGYPTENEKKERFIDDYDSKNYFKLQENYTTNTKTITISPLGLIGQEQPFYWKTDELNLYVNKTKTQIGGIRYCKNKGMFFGLEADPTSKKTAHVQLTDSWVFENFDPKIIRKIKVHSGQPIESGRLYYKVPIGSARDININNKWSHNPLIKFRQHGEGSCSFKSLSSAMSHLKLYVEATLIDDFCNEFYNTSKFEDNFHRVLQEIIQFIRSKCGFKQFKRNYTIKKLNSSHDLIQAKCCKDDIRLIILHADDKSINHAVSVVDGLIFDSNCRNAMDMSHEALTEACNGKKFVSIYQGYLFEKNHTI